jgi:thiosulfate dehydrogenase [quinone] large subunit
MAKKSVDKKNKTNYVWAALRIAIGLIFLWAFFDKMIGLGFATCRVTDPVAKTDTVTVLCEKSVAKGGSPTTGFLKFGTSGPLEDFYKDLAGNKVVDFLFMTGLLLIGLSLVSGIGVKVAVVSASLLLMMMWSAALPRENNPVLDDHIIYVIALIGVWLANKDQVWGLGKWWQRQDIVKKHPFLA